MATCPKCLGPLSEGHRCHPIWIKKLRRQVLACLVGGALGGGIQMMTTTENITYPVMGIVIGGLLFFGLSEAVRVE
jgi:hypothetical protein